MVYSDEEAAGIIGANVRRLRNLKHWTQEGLANRLAELGDGLNLSQRTLSVIEGGRADQSWRRVTIAEFYALAEALGVSPEMLLPPPAGTADVDTEGLMRIREDIERYLRGG